jgi:ubiquitin-conjugating enzyme E2 variant
VQGGRARYVAGAEVGAWLAFAALLARLVWSEGGEALAFPLAAAAGALAGGFFADLATGVVHWLCDRFGSEATPLLGRYLIAAFREHHRDPQAITRHGFLERSGSNALGAAAGLALAQPALAALAPGPAAAFAVGALVAFGLLVAFTNEIHLQAHRARRSRAVAWLQRLHLVLPPAAHARHHHGGHDRAYCIATGWSNPLLDRLRLFERLERRLRGRP